jgi:hypothetical protein
MKKLLLVMCCGMSLSGFAQNPVHGDNTKPLKLKDAAEAYMNELGISRAGVNDEDEEAEGKTMYKKEGMDYHFSRWYWYWDAHTDENGYIVSPVKTLEEWQKYKQQYVGTANKTTAAVKADWKFLGPTTSFSGYSGIGRINNVVFHPTNSNTYWVCTGGGGLWKTTNNGVNWVSLTDTLPVLGTSDLGVNPLNPNTLYLCTGDRDASDSYSIGVLKSTDGGVSWNPTGLIWTTSQLRLTNSIVINKVDTNSLTVATSNGIYKSYNGGANWTQKVAGNFKQVLAHPTDTSVLYAVTYANADMYRSANGGATWSTVASLKGKRRITLAVTAADVKIVRAIAAKSSGGLDGIYESVDTGKTFTLKYAPSGCNGDLISGSNSANPTTCGNQGWYDLAISISPTNPNLMTAGGVNSWYSTNGGVNWTRVTQWYAQFSGVATVHADKHWHTFHPLLPNRMFECNDGGIYFTDNLSSSSVWSDVTQGMGITQFYRNAVADAANFVLGGAQDNGTKSLSGTFWDDENGGDGMDCQIDYANPSTFYTATQYGDIDRVSSTWGNDQISDNIPGQPTGPWITPYIVSPHNHDHLLAGYKQVYFTPDAGDSWMSLTNGVNLESKDIERLAMTPANDSTIYVVINGTNSNGTNNVYVAHDFAPGNLATFSLITPTTSGNISDLKVDPYDKNHAWATFSGYNSPKVMEYKSGVWSNYNTNLPNVPIHCFEVDSSIGIMYVGTDVGVFYMDTINKQWEPFNTHLPSIEVTDLAINYTTKELWASTYGRGMWKSIIQDYVTVDTTDTTDTSSYIAILPMKTKGLEISPNPNPGTFKVKTTVKDLMDKTVSLSIVDNAGKLVWEGKNVFNSAGMMTVQTEAIPKGIYTLRLITDKTNVVRQGRLVIN